MSLAIFSLLMVLMMTFFIQENETQRFTLLTNQLKSAVDNTSARLRKTLESSKRVFQNNAEGNAYLSRIATGEVSPVGEIVLPTLRSQGVLAPSISCNVDNESFFWPWSVGNALFLVESKATIANTTTDKELINTYQFVLYYVSPNLDVRMPMFDNRPTLELREWRSKVFADYDQYLALSVASRSAMKIKLTSENILNLWDSDGSAPLDDFYDLDLSSLPTASKFTTLTNRNAVFLTSSSTHIYSVAYNKQPDKNAPNYFPLRSSQVPSFYKENPVPDFSACEAFDSVLSPSTAPVYSGDASRFPGGFEVAGVGSNQARNMLINLTLFAQSGQVTADQNEVNTFIARDF